MEKKKETLKRTASIKKELTIQDALIEFNRYQAANARSAQTAKSYRESLNIFSHYLSEEFGDTEQSLSMFQNISEIDNYVMVS